MRDDKRSDTRVHTVHLVSYTKFAPENIPELMGMGNTVDLSETGMRLTTKEPLAMGDTLHLTFEIDGKLVDTDAEVVHVEAIKHYSIGFRFGAGLDDDEREKIRQFLAKHQFKDKRPSEDIK